MSDFSRVDKHTAVSVNELVIEGPLFELLGRVNGQKILDLGCGSGHYAERLVRAGAIVTGVDHNPESIAVAQARKLAVATFVLADFIDYVADEPQDIALAIFSLNEMPIDLFHNLP